MYGVAVDLYIKDRIVGSLYLTPVKLVEVYGMIVGTGIHLRVHYQHVYIVVVVDFVCADQLAA